jgi:hypothetical protein
MEDLHVGERRSLEEELDFQTHLAIEALNLRAKDL